MTSKPIADLDVFTAKVDVAITSARSLVSSWLQPGGPDDDDDALDTPFQPASSTATTTAAATAAAASGKESFKFEGRQARLGVGAKFLSHAEANKSTSAPLFALPGGVTASNDSAVLSKEEMKLRRTILGKHGAQSASTLSARQTHAVTADGKRIVSKQNGRFGHTAGDDNDDDDSDDDGESKLAIIGSKRPAQQRSNALHVSKRHQKQLPQPLRQHQQSQPASNIKSQESNKKNKKRKGKGQPVSTTNDADLEAAMSLH